MPADRTTTTRRAWTSSTSTARFQWSITGKSKPPAPKAGTMPPVVLSRDQIHAVTATCSLRAPTGVRSRALIATMHRCGLRCDEALSLRWSDLRLSEGLMTVRHGKGDKSRTLGVPADCVAALALWKAFGLGPLVFCTLRGEKLDAGYVRAMLKRASRKAGLEGRGCHPHGLRHAFAQEKALAGVPLVVIRDMLGHESVATTERYLRNVAPVWVIETMRAGSYQSPTVPMPL